MKKIPKLNSDPMDEKTFVKLFLRNEFKESVFPLIVVIATLQTYFHIVIEYSSFGFQPLWIVIRLLYLPFILAIYFIWKRFFYFRRTFYLIPLAACYSYIGTYLIFFFVVTKESYVSYQLGIAQLLIALAFVPIPFLTYIIFYLLTLIYVYGGWYLTAHILNFGHNIELANFSSIYFLSFCLSIVVWRVRISRARLQYKLDNLIADHSETIRVQSSELARTKVYEAIAHTAQLVAHDVRKPFIMIKNGIKIMQRECNTESSVRLFDLLQKDIDKSLVKVNGTLKDIMYIGNKPDTNPLQNINLEELIREVVAEVSMVYPQKNYDLKIMDFLEPIFLDCNENKFNRILFNIIDNAVAAISVNGKIEIKAAKNIYSVTLDIKNDGKMIPEENLSKLFDPFFTDGKKAGTGLGLHITKLFLDEIGGTISCTSTAESGTNFNINIPVTNKI